MEDIRLLWLDLSVGLQTAELPRGFAEHCQIQYCQTENQARDLCVAGSVEVICIDFDYPGRRGLRTLQALKSSFPSIPVLMLTLQHSESLAVWAFRTRVWDYMVKPIAASEIARCFRGLKEVLEKRNDQRERSVSMPVQLIPSEASASLPEADELALLPAVNYVEKHFRAKILLEDVAPLCSMNPFRFSRVFKAAYGLGFRDYVLQYRLREACRMLENPEAVITDVCYAVGFNDTSYFTRVFRKHFHVVPSAVVGSAAGLIGDHLYQLPLFGK
jgi:YesN/AraC family two-component response regulator